MKTRREFIKISALGIGAAAIATQGNRFGIGLPCLPEKILVQKPAEPGLYLRIVKSVSGNAPHGHM
jgi:hypothetical protein